MDEQQALRILKSWHLIEFFQTYSVDEEEHSIQITASELERCSNSLLPWLNKAQQMRAGMKDGNVRYILHLGLFPKNEIEQLSNQVFGEDKSDQARYEQEQRLDTDGMTCFAKLIVDKDGSPDFKNMSVSTLPWALGHLKRGTAAELSVSAFNSSTTLLQEQLNRLSLLLPAHQGSGKPYLTASLLTELLNILCDWADFSPSSPFALQLDWLQLKAPGPTEESDLPRLTDGVSTQTEDTSVNETALQVIEEDHEISEETLPILNSFFLEDIERAMIAIAQGGGGEALLQYLSVRQNRHDDLYTPKGLQTIVRHLSPHLMPHGRWPSDPRYSMSLMQQFSINTAIQKLDEGGLLSVNGPPGTGKTTMLRDLVAHNVVERAKALASFGKVTETFNTAGYLVSSLTGFEMVVASSNNAAVENISRELPLLKSLAQEFREAEYLRPVANQLSARTNRAGEFLPLDDEEQCWGVIAAIMGKKGNRTKFSDRFFFSSHFEKESAEEAHRPNEFNFLNFWRWRSFSKNTLISFAQAKEKFNNVLAEVEQLQAQLQQLSELTARLTGDSDARIINTLTSRLNEAVSQRQKAQENQETYQKSLRLLDEKISILNDEYQFMQSYKPAWWQRLFMRTAYQIYLQQLQGKNQNLIAERKMRLALHEQITSVDNQLLSAQKKEQLAQFSLSEAQKELQNAEQRHANLKKSFPDVIIPGPEHSIEDADTQRYSFWQNETINRKRSQLFVAAMALHQSWLNEAIKSKSFRDNLFKFRDFLNSPGSANNIQGMWQLLFMIVPVISTTFASLGRMFSHVSEAQLGWLLIDEAGQALPQAAVGALWRAKRALVVGDPLQIEPVFATPPRLTKFLSEAVLADDAEEWTPAKWSVQQIADRANPYGCTLTVMDKPVWVGIPLWVHRRCIEPMFSLANHIAYENRMIHGLSEQAILSKPLEGGLSNCWYTSEGDCSHRQFKNELALDTQRLLHKLSDAGYKLADIYVITPFKAVRAGLVTALQQPDAVDKLSRQAEMSRTELKAWRSKHIGTVHTFQGKENNIVILVLGCDTSHQGGAEWAASKPNLLNVALTRAKNHIFVIGDLRVWGDKTGFDQVASSLPERSLN
ncbi:AAA domain-containing protein [Erwinia sp. E_sp_W01_1]|uniref:DEAD/DEAH box helicase n=1 Tax=Erwinia sp. E_sp_W01_1 TaxID=3039407 RepID=UPI0030CCD605